MPFRSLLYLVPLALPVYADVAFSRMNSEKSPTALAELVAPRRNGSTLIP